jgi:putative oxidoreductase
VQNPLRVVARILTGSTYVMLGADALLAPGKRPEIAAETLATIRKVVPLPADDTVVVQANAAVQVASGTMLALGRAPRLAALALAASLLPTTAAAHLYWTIEDPVARQQQKIQFWKNSGLLGGLLLAVLDPN